MRLRDKTIYIFSPEPWGINHVSKHHYALELATRGNRVYFFNPPKSALGFQVVGAEEIKDNLSVVSYRVQKGLNKLPFSVRKKLLKRNAWGINKYLKSVPDVVWSFDPYVFQDLSIFNQKGIQIYFPVDVHRTRLENELVRSADHIFCTTSVIRDHLKTDVKVIGHGLAEHFVNTDYSSSHSDSQKIIVGMVGNLQRGIDYDLLFELIELHPEIKFRFIGPYKNSNLTHARKYDREISRLLGFQNTYLLGEVDNADLPNVIAKIDVFLMCYIEAENPATLAFPHKLLEYLSTGKTVLLNNGEFFEGDFDVVVATENKASFLEAFDRIIENLEEYNAPPQREKRIAIAKTNTYSHKVDQIEKCLN